MKIRPLLLWIAFICAAADHCLGQSAENWRVYRASDGLPQTYVSSVTIGARGRIWTSHPGLEWIGRLNGYDVQAVPAPNKSPTRVCESGSGQIWAFNDGDLYEYRQDNGWIKYNTPELSAFINRNKLTPVYPIPLLPLRQNHVLVLMPERLLECNIEDPTHPLTTLVRGAGKTGLQTFSGMILTSDGSVWVAGRNGLLKSASSARNLRGDSKWHEYLFNPKLGISRLRQIADDNAGGIIGLAEFSRDGQQALVHFDGRNWMALPVNGNKLLQVWRTPDRSLWAFTATTLLQMKSGEKQFSRHDEIAPRRIMDCAVETNGNFWLATSDGLFRYAPLTWRTPPNLNDVTSPVGGISEDASNVLWVVAGKSIHLLRNEMWTEHPLPSEIVTNTTVNRAVFTLTNGITVLTAENHLYLLNPTNGNFHAVATDSFHRSLGLLKDGLLCVQTLNEERRGGRLEEFNGIDFLPFSHSQPEGADSNIYQFLFYPKNGSLCLGYGTGLAIYESNQWQMFPLPTRVNFSSSTRMVEVRENRFWLNAEARMMEFNGKNWDFVRNSFENINSLIQSRDGSIWMASDSGVQRFFRGTWVGNGVEEGLPAASVLSIFEDHLGRIWAGTSRGLSQYHPEADEDPPHTLIQSLPGENNSAPENSLVTITFDGKDKWKFTKEENLFYSYRVDGLDWSAYQEQHNVTLLDMAAGEHTLRVRSMDRNWNVDPQPALLQFKITVPWYRESRLMLAYSAGSGVALFFAGLAFNRHRRLVKSYAEVEAKVALRTRQLELANQELFHSQKMNALGTLAAGIAHDFNNILSIIKGSAQIIEDNLGNQIKVKTRADRIKTVVEQGAGIVKAMLGFSRGSEHQLAMCDVNAVARETITLLGDRFLREVEVQFQPAESPIPDVPASKDFLQQILLNFIFNAAEASTGRQKIILRTSFTTHLPSAIALKPAIVTSYVTIQVQDFGMGIAPDIMPRIFEPFFTTKSLSARRGTGLGLSMVYELARQMECGLTVNSAVGMGSTFSLIIPVRDLPLESGLKKG